MCVQNVVPIGQQATTCIPSEGYTHTQTHTLSYIDIDGGYWLTSYVFIILKSSIDNEHVDQELSHTGW